MKRIWHIIWLVLHDRYPPRVFVFHPLYRTFRRRFRIPMAVSNLLVWTVSAVLHGGVVLASGHPDAGLVFAALFLFLGVLSTIVILTTKQTAGSVRTKLAKL